MQDVINSATASFEKMRDLVRLDNTTSYEDRIKYLKALRKAVMDNIGALQQALDEDFDGRSPHETQVADIMPTITTIDYSIKNLRKWLKGEKKPTEIQFLPAKNRIEFHPKGVILIISPWNYPVSLSLLPMASAIAAGNRVILKPSECTPKTSELMVQIVKSALPADRAMVFTGGPELSAKLTSLDFDHIVFTGSTRVGRMVMQSAANNLTPVTLELGGKSPAIVHEEYDLELAASRIARGKLFNAGQTCIAPDYVMIPANKTDEFVTFFKKAARRLYPQFAGNGDYSSIVSQSQFVRLNALLDDAQKKGAKIISLDEKNQRSSGNRKLHPHLVLDISNDMKISEEEIFGPILIVIPYDDIDEASAYINQRPHPLSLYYFDDNSERVQEFLSKTISGGAVVNDTILQFVQEALPFGGVGNSGMGVCHGYEGFRELSHAKSVFYQSKINGGFIIYPPYGRLFERIMEFLVR
ncbi:MAG: coniferyl aldehyde dehydrogenase [Devosiaceae bacterium]|nr:coniferyl aldehyde dehydrogenase [Devosiaceae bacterium]